MQNDLRLFKVASALADHASARQMAVAGNIANADTPGYKARDLEAFSETYQPATQDHLRTTRARHIADPLDPMPASFRVMTQEGDESPNGNSVSLETEMMKSVEIRQSHDMALSVYRSGLELLRSGLGR